VTNGPTRDQFYSAVTIAVGLGGLVSAVLFVQDQSTGRLIAFCIVALLFSALSVSLGLTRRRRFRAGRPRD
jgi:hypothetical protein